PLIRFSSWSASRRAIGRASTISRWVAQARRDALPRCLRTIWRKHDEHPDNLVDFSQAFGATQLLQSAHQPHSGYIEGNQLLLFSNQADAHREAVGDALIGPGQTLLNVGIHLPLASLDCGWRPGSLDGLREIDRSNRGIKQFRF